VKLVETLSLRVGHRLIPLVDVRQQGELSTRIKSLRKKFAQDVGFLPPVVHVRDNLELPANTYIISLKGVEVGRGEIYPGKWLAINPGKVTGQLQGKEAIDPAFGLPAIWIEQNLREHGQIYGYTVVDASTVAATHLNHLLHQHAKDMLGRSEVQKLLDKLGGDGKGLVEEVIPKLLSLTQLQRILQNLLEENVPIRDLRTILDALAEHAGAQQPADIQELTAQVRVALGRSIVNQYYANKPELRVIGPRFQPGAGGDAGSGQWRRAGAEPGGHLDERDQPGTQAPGAGQRPRRAGGAQPLAPGAVAFPAPAPAPAHGHRPERSAR
jgi:Flagellar biosynthesis pathway, component FlhA